MSTDKKFGLKNLNKKLGPMTVSSFLRSWRESNAISQQDFAKILKISAANLCDIEKGRKGVSPEKAAEIAKIIGYSPTVLIELALNEQLKDAGLAYDVELKPRSKKAI